MESDSAAAHRYYEAVRNEGVDLFLEKRTTCPWCGSPALTPRLHTVDLIQGKDGQFVLDACKACAHVFQNPRLSKDGLEYYYRDFYDGLGKERMRAAFAGRRSTYRQRARAVSPIEKDPALWLDVGAGYGHFCESAQEVFPRTRFHGSDSSEGIDDALRSGRVIEAFREPLSALSQRLEGRYDVVSMYHYLEHTASPREELRQAAALLKPQGLLVIEVPNSDCPMSRWLGRYWLPWLQPQHLHFVPAENLIKELTSLGFHIEHFDTAAPHDPIDLCAALLLWLNGILPPVNVPWRTQPPSLAARISRRVARLLALPLLIIARCLDLGLVGPLLKMSHRGNAYRLIVRKGRGCGSR